MHRSTISLFAVLATALIATTVALPGESAVVRIQPSTSTQIDYRGFRDLTQEVQAYRDARLVNLSTFQKMSRELHTIILDARSAAAFKAGHIKGAVNLSFSDFTAQSLAATLGNPSTRILIYCNNNFENNEPPVLTKSVKLALNIQTFINLYGYGYRNVYELGDVVNFNDPEVHWVKG